MMASSFLRLGPENDSTLFPLFPKGQAITDPTHFQKKGRTLNRRTLKEFMAMFKCHVEGILDSSLSYLILGKSQAAEKL